MAEKKKDKNLKYPESNSNDELGDEDKALIEKSLRGELTERSALGLERIDPSIFPPPRIKLVQPSTQNAEDPQGEEIPEGMLWNTASAESFETLECAFLKAGITRARFEKGVIDQPPLCVSRDGIHGSSGEYCPECSYSQWKDGPPECRRSIEFLGISEDGDVFVIRFSGTSFKHARNFLGKVRYAHKPLFSYKVKLVPEKQVGSKGKYYELKVLIEGDRDEEAVKKLYEDYVEFGKAYMPSAIEDTGD